MGKLFWLDEQARRKRLAAILAELHQLHPDDYRAMGGTGARAEPLRRVAAGRNQPCPCGAGKKFKYCCGKE